MSEAWESDHFWCLYNMLVIPVRLACLTYQTSYNYILSILCNSDHGVFNSVDGDHSVMSYKANLQIVEKHWLYYYVEH